MSRGSWNWQEFSSKDDILCFLKILQIFEMLFQIMTHLEWHRNKRFLLGKCVPLPFEPVALALRKKISHEFYYFFQSNKFYETFYLLERRKWCLAWWTQICGFFLFIFGLKSLQISEKMADFDEKKSNTFSSLHTLLGEKEMERNFVNNEKTSSRNLSVKLKCHEIWISVIFRSRFLTQPL